MTPRNCSNAVKSWYRADLKSVTVGDARVTQVQGGIHWWDGGNFFGVVPKILWSKFQPPDELNRIAAGFNSYVIEIGGKTLLVDTGGGIRHEAVTLERMAWPNPEFLPETLARHGFEASKIDCVINTHLHWDHCAGNTMDEAGGKVLPTFPNAKYVTQGGELAAAREGHPRVAMSYRPVNYEPLVESGSLQLLDGDTELVPGVTLRVMPGHNRDMMVVQVRSGQEVWCMFSDLVPFAAHVTPTWVAAFDFFPLQTIASKTELLTRAAAEGWWCSFGHDPEVAFAKVETDGRKWRAVQTI